MMKVKTFEIRDKMTFIPALAIKLEPYHEADRYLLARAGFGIRPDEQGRYVLLIRLEGLECQYSPDNWRGSARTMPEAHRYIVQTFDALEHGAVVDVQSILGETEGPRVSEREGSPL